MIRYIFAMVFLLVTPLQAQDLGGMIGDMEQQPDLEQPQPEQPPGFLQRYNVNVLCGPTMAVKSGLNSRGQFIFTSAQKYPEDEGIFDYTVLMLNPQTTEYTFLYLSTQYGMACIVHQGINLRIFSPPE